MANFSKSDLEFILKQIFIAEANADGTSLIDLLPNTQVPFGPVSYTHLTLPTIYSV